MATVKCKLRKRRRPSREWFDGEKWRIYCYGYIDKMNDEILEECRLCPDHVFHAQEDLESFYARKAEKCQLGK